MDHFENVAVNMQCKYCGKTINFQVVTSYDQAIGGYEEERPNIIIWSILECIACQGIMFQRTYMDGPAKRYGMSDILYPNLAEKSRSIDSSLLPAVIKKEYETALRVLGVSTNACAVMARRTLEAIAAYEKVSGNTLAVQVENLLKSERIPRLLADMAHLGRRIGNLGAHFDEDDVTEADIEAS